MAVIQSEVCRSATSCYTAEISLYFRHYSKRCASNQLTMWNSMAAIFSFLSFSFSLFFLLSQMVVDYCLQFGGKEIGHTWRCWMETATDRQSAVPPRQYRELQFTCVCKHPICFFGPSLPSVRKPRCEEVQ